MTLLYSEHKRLYFWNLIVLVFSTFATIMLPIQLLFHAALSAWWWALYLVMCAVFLTDVFVRHRRFRKEQMESGLRTRFPVIPMALDILAAIPFGVILGFSAAVLLHLTKLWRVSRDLYRFRQAEVQYSTPITLAAFVYWAFILIHLLACGWLWIHGIDTMSDHISNYITSLYWTVTTLTSVGYGDIIPVTNPQRLYAILVQLSGIGLFGYLIANVVTIISGLDAAQARYREHADMLSMATRNRDLPIELQRRVLNYYRYMRDDRTGYDERAFLASLPESLRAEVAVQLKKEFIENIPLFRHAGERFIYDIALKLELIVATPGDYIFRVDDSADKMYFVVSGTLEVLNRNGEKFAVLNPGDFFGEIALFRNTARTATVQAITYCNLYILNRKTFETALTLYPEVAAKMQEEAHHREERNAEGLDTGDR